MSTIVVSTFCARPSTPCNKPFVRCIGRRRGLLLRTAAGQFRVVFPPLCPPGTSQTTTLFCRTRRVMPQPRPSCESWSCHARTSTPRFSCGPSSPSRTVAQPRTTSANSSGHSLCTGVPCQRYPPPQVLLHCPDIRPNIPLRVAATPATILITEEGICAHVLWPLA